MAKHLTSIQKHILSEALRDPQGYAPHYQGSSPRQDDLAVLVTEGYLVATLVGHQLTDEGRARAPKPRPQSRRVFGRHRWL
jgi:hypothetical protein